MSPTWDSNTHPEHDRVSPLGWLRFGLRAVLLVILVFGSLMLLLALRVVERPLFGIRRPLTPHITKWVCRNALRILRLPLVVSGQPMRGQGAIVANHTSWLDIFVLNASDCVYFVSKSEVAGWPGIGWLARATGTVFIARDPKEAAAQKQVFEDRLLARHRLLFFPEGTSTDGQQVLPFKSTLFAAFFAQDLREHLSVQPVSVVYHAPASADPRFYGWWGDMGFGEHLITTLATARQGRVEVVYHAPIRVSDTQSRKQMAQQAETLVRQGHEAARR
ncbi:MAG: 1-acyl-sn-glycerol-3-phosphate acyltransferase [Rhodobacteraceae bacterium]|nr:1-acyl-sn-glycerol-3-phosphate acyltransferase [Paracoccaceae bacterium]